MPGCLVMRGASSLVGGPKGSDSIMIFASDCLMFPDQIEIMHCIGQEQTAR